VHHVALGYFRPGVPARGPPLPAWLLARPPSQRNGVSTTEGIQTQNLLNPGRNCPACRVVRRNQRTDRRTGRRTIVLLALGTAFNKLAGLARRTTVLCAASVDPPLVLATGRARVTAAQGCDFRALPCAAKFLSVNVADSVDRYAAVAVCITTAQSPFLERGRRSPRHTTFVKSPPRPACPRGASGGA
jgi:hypothetical protein